MMKRIINLSPILQFVGVPVFQAEGLTVTTQEMVRRMLCFYVHSWL